MGLVLKSERDHSLSDVKGQDEDRMGGTRTIILAVGGFLGVLLAAAAIHVARGRKRYDSRYTLTHYRG